MPMRGCRVKPYTIVKCLVTGEEYSRGTHCLLSLPVNRLVQQSFQKG